MNKGSRNAALDTLRAIATLWVVAHHIVLPFGLSGFSPVLTTVMGFGNAGVDLFFVLSGYLITGLILAELRKGQGFNVGRFWWRRWMRTLPAYYATFAVMYSFYLYTGQAQHQEGVGPYLVFLQNYISPLTYFAWSWSLCVEEQFYLVLPLIVIGLRRYWPRLTPEELFRGIALTAVLAAIAARWGGWLGDRSIGLSWHQMSQHVYWVTHTRLDGLAAGILIATLPKPRVSTRLLAASGAAVALLLVVMFAPLPQVVAIQRSLLLALAFGTIVYASLGDSLWSKLKIPGARLTADLSYSLYLTHPLVLWLIVRGLAGWHWTVRLAVFSLVSLGASVALRWVVEVPFLRLRDRFDQSNRLLRKAKEIARTQSEPNYAAGATTNP